MSSSPVVRRCRLTADPETFLVACRRRGSPPPDTGVTASRTAAWRWGGGRSSARTTAHPRSSSWPNTSGSGERAVARTDAHAGCRPRRASRNPVPPDYREIAIDRSSAGRARAPSGRRPIATCGAPPRTGWSRRRSPAGWTGTPGRSTPSSCSERSAASSPGSRAAASRHIASSRRATPGRSSTVTSTKPAAVRSARRSSGATGRGTGRRRGRPVPSTSARSDRRAAGRGAPPRTRPTPERRTGSRRRTIASRASSSPVADVRPGTRS